MAPVPTTHPTPQELTAFSQGKLTGMAADTVALMDRLGIERAHYVGHSTGGAMGQTIAQEHPDRLLSLVLSATWAGPDAYFFTLVAMSR